MDSIMKIMLDMTISEDIEKWLLKTENGSKINTEEVYFAHTVYIDENQTTSDEEFRILIDSSIRTPHNKFFVDVINEETVGIINGSTGFAMISNTGRCVDFAEPLSIKYGKKIANFDEIKEFVNEQNREISNKKIK